jgi:tRNA dimethylallyltransferase
VWLAERLNGEVVVCDSTQVYRHFDIGTGKVTPQEQRGIPHHLMDLLEPDEAFTAGEYRRRAIAVLEDLRGRGKLPLFTVGTGLYLRALLEGLAAAPTRSEELRERLRRRARKAGVAQLHRALARLDREAAARIGPNDQPKIIRAIEVRLLSGKRITELHREGRAPLEGYAPIRIGLMPKRAALYERIDRRVEAMLAAGWLDEVRRLVARNLSATAKPFQFLGYRELRDVTGPQTPPEVTAAIQQNTRRYAKRQITWFRKEPQVRWFEGFGDDRAIAEAALAHLRHQLGV